MDPHWHLFCFFKYRNIYCLSGKEQGDLGDRSRERPYLPMFIILYIFNPVHLSLSAPPNTYVFLNEFFSWFK